MALKGFEGDKKSDLGGDLFGGDAGWLALLWTKIVDERVDSEGFFLRGGGGVSTAEDFRRLGRRGGGGLSAAGKLGWKRREVWMSMWWGGCMWA